MNRGEGIYANMPVSDYFADPTPAPSLNQSLVKIILDKSPLHAWYAHPRLNPDFVRDEDRKYDVANIAHMLLIGRGRELVILPHEDWRTKEAKALRDEATAQNKLAVLGKHYELADRMVRSARQQLEQRDYPQLFSDQHGDGEAVLIWSEKSIWCRQMIDWLAHDYLIVTDYKTTQESAAPHTLARKMAADGWHIQAAMAERGLAHLDPKNIGRRRYLFVVQEVTSPYLLNVVEMSEAALTMGRKQLRAGIDVWKRCIETNYFSGYPLQTIVPDFPEWAEAQWLDREQTEFDDARNVLMAG